MPVLSVQGCRVTLPRTSRLGVCPAHSLSRESRNNECPCHLLPKRPSKIGIGVGVDLIVMVPDGDTSVERDVRGGPLSCRHFCCQTCRASLELGTRERISIMRAIREDVQPSEQSVERCDPAWVLSLLHSTLAMIPSYEPFCHF